MSTAGNVIRFAVGICGWLVKPGGVTQRRRAAVREELTCSGLAEQGLRLRLRLAACCALYEVAAARFELEAIAHPNLLLHRNRWPARP